MPPLSLTDDEYAAVEAAAAPVHHLQRSAFLKALAAELERYPVVGPGIVHRCAAALQKTFVVAAQQRNGPCAASFEGEPGGRLSGVEPSLGSDAPPSGSPRPRCLAPA
jgi:hypothetical protein